MRNFSLIFVRNQQDRFDAHPEYLNWSFGIWVGDSTVALHLHRMKLSCQVPCYRAREQDPKQVADFLDHKFHRIQ
jgi:transposase